MNDGKSGRDLAPQVPLLQFDDVTVHYGAVEALRGVNYLVYPGEIVCLLGGNASGKSTSMKAALGVATVTRGRVLLDGEDVTHLPTPARIARGMGIVPENRRIFPKLTVRENLQLGAYLRSDSEEVEADLAYVFSCFPRLKERLGQLGGTLSGGEQQMLAMGRALMSRPKLILMDEPTMGLSPRFVDAIFDVIRQVNEAGVSLFIVEQNAHTALSVADRGYVLQTGEVVLAGPARDLLANEDMKRAYLGQVARPDAATR